jgi:formylglycine-generating enzyme required for sulfatase activity
MLTNKSMVFILGVVIVVSMCVEVSRANVYDMPTGQTSLDFVTVGDAGNAADPSTGYGAVPYAYQVGKYDVTLGQYCQFLNAVAKTDTYGLYNSRMATDYPTVAIAQNGSSGSYSYSITGGYSAAANCPVFEVSWGDAARFCNWLQNNQPAYPAGTAGEVAGSTETGAYTLNGATNTSALMAITRNAGATDFIPSEDEWYKAAYYKGGTNAGYWLYPTQSNAAPSNELSATGTNNANYYNRGYSDPTNYLTPVGAFAASPGPYGTYDMGGDIWQWNETHISDEYGDYRGLRGGVWNSLFSSVMTASYRAYDDPADEDKGMGFRVASIPEPASMSLLVCGAIIGLIWWRCRQ